MAPFSPTFQGTLAEARHRVRRAGVRIVSSSRRESDQAIFWLVTCAREGRRYCTVIQTSDQFHCDCQDEVQAGGLCLHQEAVQVWLLTRGQPGGTPRMGSAEADDPARMQSAQVPGSGSHQQASRHSLAATLQGEHALPWTDDKPFSMWKS